MITDRGYRFGSRAIIVSERGHFAIEREALPRAHAHARGRADVARTRTIVGITTIESMLMTPGAQANELARIDADMRAFADEIAAAAKAHGDDAPLPPAHATTQQIIDYAKAIGAQPAKTGEAPIVSLFRAAWLPLWHTWTTFYAANKSGAWWSNPVSEAEVYQRQLIDIRDQAGKLGIALQTPGPKIEHPEGLPSWLLPVGVGVGALVALSILARSHT